MLPSFALRKLTKYQKKKYTQEVIFSLLKVSKIPHAKQSWKTSFMDEKFERIHYKIR